MRELVFEQVYELCFEGSGNRSRDIQTADTNAAGLYSVNYLGLEAGGYRDDFG